MATLNAEHINPFLMAAKKVLQDMCFVDVAIQKPILKEAKFDHDNWVIIIGVTGEMRGQVLIGMTEETACAIASKMCMMEVKTIDDFASSAIGELGNMIMGNAATMLSQKGVIVDITPPSLAIGTVNIVTTYAQNICVPLSGGDITIELDVAVKA